MHQENKKAPNKFIPALTGIRAICVYFIFFYHNHKLTPLENPKSFILFNQFYTFLTFFFVLSGFVICHKYYSISSLKRKDLYNYFINRFSRVFPVLFILISITFLLQYLYHADTAGHIIKTWFYNVTLLKGFSSEYFLTGIGPSWSMSVEELFYALSPFIFLYATKTSSLLKFVLLFYSLGILITFIFTRFNADGFFSSFSFTFYTTFFGRVFEFVCGIYLAMVVKGKFKKGLFEETGNASLYLGIAVIILSITGLYFTSKVYNVAHGIEAWPGLLLNNVCMPIGITFLFYSLIYYKSFLQQFLSSRLMVALGNSTYSFYLLHTCFIFTWMNKYLGKNIFINFFAMIVFAFIFYKTVEQPLANFLRKKLYSN